jgi:hypothetical protein
MRTVAFVVDQKQDFYLSLAWARLLRDDHPRVTTMAVLTHGSVLPEFEGHLQGFDHVKITEAPFPPSSLRQIPGMLLLIRRFRRTIAGLGLGEDDAVVGYSFRALVLTALIRALKRPRPRLVRVRQCNHELERKLTRRRPFVSAYWNLWNRAFGAGPMRYRWLPSSNRHGGGVFLRDPYDDEFCVTSASSADPARRRLPWPFPILRGAAGAAGNRPTLVFLGERYPLVEGQSLDELRSFLHRVLAEVRRLHPEHRLVFKPRSTMSEIGLDLSGWEVAEAERLLESLLVEDPSVEKVLSFKSSGSIVASQYGCAGYVLYPLIDLPDDFRSYLDDYFADYRDDLTFVDDLEALAATGTAHVVDADQVAALARPLIELLARS